MESPSDLNIILRDVRSFTGRHSIPVRPLTILLGENSTGKSTFLAVASAVLDEASFPLRLAFNRPPYALGTHDNVLSNQSRKKSKSADLAVGFTLINPSHRERSEVVATYAGRRGRIELSKLLLKGPKGQLTLSIEAGIVSGTLTIQDAGEQRQFDFHVPEAAIVGDLYSIVITSRRCPSSC